MVDNFNSAEGCRGCSAVSYVSTATGATSSRVLRVINPNNKAHMALTFNLTEDQIAGMKAGKTLKVYIKVVSSADASKGVWTNSGTTHTVDGTPNGNLSYMKYNSQGQLIEYTNTSTPDTFTLMILSPNVYYVCFIGDIVVE